MKKAVLPHYEEKCPDKNTQDDNKHREVPLVCLCLPHVHFLNRAEYLLLKPGKLAEAHTSLVFVGIGDAVVDIGVGSVKVAVVLKYLSKLLE